MMKYRRLWMDATTGVIVLSIALMSNSASAAPPTLELVTTIPLPDVQGRIDHLSVDVSGHRVFVAALGNDTVELIDTERNERRTLRGLGEPQGVLYLPEQQRLVIANGSAGRVDFVDVATLSTVARVAGLDDADNVRWYAASNTVLVGYGKGGLRKLDVTGKAGMDIQLPGHPESFQVDPGTRRGYVNVPAAHAVIVVDLETGRTIARWPTPKASSNFPMALDVEAHRLYVGARSPAVLLVYDTETGSVLSRVPIGGDTDDVYFDAQRKRVYAICGEGRVDVLRQQSLDQYVVEESVKTSPGARTGLFVAEEARLYVAARASGGSAARLLVYRVN